MNRGLILHVILHLPPTQEHWKVTVVKGVKVDRDPLHTKCFKCWWWLECWVGGVILPEYIRPHVNTASPRISVYKIKNRFPSWTWIDYAYHFHPCSHQILHLKQSYSHQIPHPKDYTCSFCAIFFSSPRHWWSGKNHARHIATPVGCHPETSTKKRENTKKYPPTFHWIVVGLGW